MVKRHRQAAFARTGPGPHGAAGIKFGKHFDIALGNTGARVTKTEGSQGIITFDKKHELQIWHKTLKQKETGQEISAGFKITS